MNKFFTLALSVFLLFSCSDKKREASTTNINNNNTTHSTTINQEINYDVEGRLEELGIELLPQTPPTASFVKTRRSGNFIFLSGHGPDRPEGGQVIGKLGNDLTVEQGAEAARLTGISLLSSLKAEIGDLNNVTRIVKAVGMVNADPSFTQHSQVVNGFSDLMVEIFEDNGRHARSSVGMSSLPSNIAVEIELIVEIKE